MKLPLNWLKDYVLVHDTPEKLAELLTLSGSEVERIEKPPQGIDSIIVGLVTAVNKHPNADKLSIAKVRVSKKEGDKTVVCGAPNIAVGQKVAIALPGATLPTGIKIEKTAIRGVTSHGMILAEDEMGLGDDHTGIVVLDEKARIGSSVKTVFSFSPAVFDLDIKPHRADCFSIEGLAREVAALTKKKLKAPKVKELPKKVFRQTIPVKILDKKMCPQYMACRMNGVSVGPSPEKLAIRLREAGIRPINNVVDITNYVMLATGQPLHAFDEKKLTTKQKQPLITVRKAASKESIAALDEKTYTLDNSMLVIADAKKPIALAGIIGGTDSAVTAETASIILEAAVFDPVAIRKTSRALGVRTESSTRFEKGLNHNGTKRALEMAVQMIEKYASGQARAFTSIPPFKEKKQKSITIQSEYFGSFIGKNISRTFIKAALTSLGFAVKVAKGGTIIVKVPPWRLDVAIPEDVIEEVARFYGMNHLPITTITADVVSPPRNQARTSINLIRFLMAAQGFYEIMSYSFYSDSMRRGDALSMFCDGRYDHITISNPLSPEQKYLRKSIIPFVLKSLAKNIALEHAQWQVKLFELGRIFIPQGKHLPREDTILAGAMNFEKDAKEHNLLYIKGILENIFYIIGIPLSHFKLNSLRAGGVVFEHNHQVVATIYILNKHERETYKIKKPVGIFEVSLSRLLALDRKRTVCEPLPRYPSIERDLALEFESTLLWQSVRDAISGSSRLLERIEFLNQYHISHSKKSLAFRLSFRAEDTTLTAEEVDVEIKKITSLLENRFHATLRGESNAKGKV